MQKTILTIGLKDDLTEFTNENIKMELPITNNKISITNVNDFIKEKIVRTENKFGKPTTVVDVVLVNGMILSESTTCVDPESYEETIGEGICMGRIYDKIFFGLGFALSCANVEFKGEDK